MILLTGASGYIGSLMMECFGDFMIGIDSGLRPSNYTHKNLYNVDIQDIDALSNIFETFPITKVINLAAVVGDPACDKYPEQAKQSNILGLVNLLDLCREHHISRFVQASTCSVYGFNNYDVDECSEVNPLSLYAMQKVAAETLVKESGLPYFILRFATAFGWSPVMRFDLTINEFAFEFFYERPVNIFRENDWRPYCHVADLGQCAYYFARLQRESGVYNIGNYRNNYTKKCIVAEMEKIFPKIGVQYVLGTGSDPRNYRVNFDKLTEVMHTTDYFLSVPTGISEIKCNLKNSTLSYASKESKFFRGDILNERSE